MNLEVVCKLTLLLLELGNALLLRRAVCLVRVHLVF
jgi:hypothetical protein